VAESQPSDPRILPLRFEIDEIDGINRIDRIDRIEMMRRF